MYDDIHNQELKSLLEHLSENNIDHYAKIFSENRIINPLQDKDTDDVIRAYWSIQDVQQYRKYLVNPIQQRIRDVLHANPLLIDKLYRCRGQFVKQQKEYTDSVRAILKFGKYPFFTTEWDSSVQSMYSDKAMWNDTTGIANKQLCILVAHTDTTFVKSMPAGDNHTYSVGLSNIWKMISTAANLSYIGIHGYVPILQPMYGQDAYIETSRSATVQDVNRRNEKIADKYAIVYGDPFSLAAPKDVNTSIGHTYSGVVSRYGLIETHCFDTEQYRTVLDPYLFHSDLFEENRQLYTYTKSRFDNIYPKILRAFVDRAIMIAHQTLVDLCISVYEDTYTLPQLNTLYCPGSMVKTQNKYKYTQPSMVLYTDSNFNKSNGCFNIHRLTLTRTKIDNVLKHTPIYGECQSNDSNEGLYVNTLYPAKHRGGVCFKYFTYTNNVELMTDADVRVLFPEVIKQLLLLAKPIQKQLGGIYYHRKWVSGENTVEKVQYDGRIIVDNISKIATWYDDPSKYQVKHDFQEVYDQYSKGIDSFVYTPYPGPKMELYNITPNNPILLTTDDLLDDVRYVLSLPVMCKSYILKDKVWGTAHISDIKDIEYQKDAYAQLTAPDIVKDLILTITQYHNKNYFKDLINDKEGGCVLLLTGDSSTGKTLTVEAISELLEKPLYSISAGELGDRIYEVDDSLSEILKMATSWDAIVLIDEADVFLSKRTANSDIEKNAITSIFLRQLEYFKGILFLTSNFISNIDTAFMNRITKIINFNNLTVDDLANIWINLSAKQGVQMDDTDAHELAKFVSNGRDIKNMLKIAIAYCIKNDTPLTVDTIKDTVKICETKM